MKQQLIDFYLEWMKSELTKRDFALRHNLRIKELNEITTLGMNMYLDEKNKNDQQKD